MDDSVAEIALRSQRYKDLCSQVAVSLQEVDVQCSSFLSALTPDGDVPLAHPAERLETLDKFSGGLDTPKQDVTELLACGKYLVAVLDVLECSDTPKALEIQHRIDGVAVQLETVVNAIETKRSELVEEVEHFTKTEADLKKIVDWLECVDERRHLLSSRISLNKEGLSQYAEIEKCRKAEVIRWQQHIDEVTERCRQLRMSPEKYAGLPARCSCLVTSAIQHTEHLEAVQQRLVNLHKRAENIKCWITDAALSLTCRSALVDNFAEQRTYIENLSNQWRLKRQEFEELLASVETFASVELCLDSSPLDQLFTDVEHDWCQLSKSFVNYISDQVSLCSLIIVNINVSHMYFLVVASQILSKGSSFGG